MGSILKFDKRILKQKKLMLLPGGPIEISLIEEVKPGSVVWVDPDNNLRLVQRDEDLDLSALNSPKATTKALDEGYVAFFKCNFPAGDRLQSLTATWKVPPAPELRNGQTLYLFNGVQTGGSRNSILQPVLQWQTDEQTGEKFWSVSSYCVTSTQQAKHTPFIPVEPGKTLTGVIKFVKLQGQNLVYSVEFSNVPGTKLFVSIDKPIELMLHAFELYNLEDCRELPDTNKTEFVNVKLTTRNGFTATWVANDLSNACGLGAAVDAGGRLNVFY